MPLKLTRRSDKGNWYIRGTVRGREIFESTGTDNKRAAEEIRIKRENEVLNVSIHGESIAYTFTDAAISYITAGGDATHVQPLLDHFKGVALATIDQRAIDQAASKLKPGRAPATLNRQIYTPISAILNHAAGMTPPWCSVPKIKRPQVPNGRVRWITHAEAERLIAAAKPHIKPLVIFLLGTGCRLSEALYLNWREVDLSRGHVTIVGPEDAETNRIRTKNNTARGIPLHPRVVAALAEMPHRHGAVFRKPVKGKRATNTTLEARKYGLPYEDRGGVGGGQIKSTWATMCDKAKIPDFTPHDCRHTWATWHYIANRDVAKLMELGGWKSLDMVMRYTHVNVDHLKPSIEAMWA